MPDGYDVIVVGAGNAALCAAIAAKEICGSVLVELPFHLAGAPS